MASALPEKRHRRDFESLRDHDASGEAEESEELMDFGEFDDFDQSIPYAQLIDEPEGARGSEGSIRTGCLDNPVTPVTPVIAMGVPSIVTAHVSLADASVSSLDGRAERTEATEATAEGAPETPSIPRSREEHAILFFDGASKKNPGPSGSGWHLTRLDGTTIAIGWRYVGDNATNNEAEYEGIMGGLLYASTHSRLKSLQIKGDSNLVIMQASGNWNCKATNLIPKLECVLQLIRSLNRLGCSTELSHVGRAHNSVADSLCDIAVRDQYTGHVIHVYPSEDKRVVVDREFLRKKFGRFH